MAEQLFTVSEILYLVERITKYGSDWSEVCRNIFKEELNEIICDDIVDQINGSALIDFLGLDPEELMYNKDLIEEIRQHYISTYKRRYSNDLRRAIEAVIKREVKRNQNENNISETTGSNTGI
jgi:hypothetical protein